ncbi:MAG: AraC family transcriptional regulator [Clostridiaceae bacterium]|nr:AraC family transcriptional regulator [Clostridiaceae bacterium]
MSYFSMEYLGFHQIAYAHALTVVDYQFSFSTAGFGIYRAPESETSGVIEIGYVVKNPLVIENHTTGECYTAEEGDVFIFPPNHDISVHSKNSGEHKHITSEYMIDARVAVHRWSDINEVNDSSSGNQIALPYLIPSSAAGHLIANQIRKVAADQTLLIKKSFFKQSADFCSLIEALRKASDPIEQTHSNQILKYKTSCKKAEEYIERNILQHIRIQEIADAVGISKNYLINIFPKYKGIGLTEYINRVKLNRMLLMMTRYGYSMKQACECVGYNDVNYVSRIFPKYYGVPLREYCRMTYQKVAKDGK